MTWHGSESRAAEDAMPSELATAVDAAWERAQSHWSGFLLLGRPLNDVKDTNIAKIHLGTRQISLNGDRIVKQGLLDCVEALVAHEMGHHVLYPGTLAVDARLRLLEKQLVPIEGCSLANLFTDLLINEALGKSLRDSLIRLYQAFQGDRGWGSDPAFSFYMAVYEELWGLAPGTLVGEQHLAPLAERFEGYRSEAHVLSQDLFRLGPNLYTQFVYFVSVMSRYLSVPAEHATHVSGDPLQCRCGEPSPEDWADALRPSLAEREALERAEREGWISTQHAVRLLGDDALDRRIASLPGQGTADAERVPEIMAAHYRREAERFLVRPPAKRVLGEAIVPTVLEDWELGEPTTEIDWISSIRLRGAELAVGSPLRRERIAEEEGYEVPLWQRKTEIYLDVSGSMPDPRTTLNAMTLAAQILAGGTIRGGGLVRALVYSTDVWRYWDYCRSEREISLFLMHYIGGGTEFPFEVLRDSLQDSGGVQPIRVVITDSDFDRNYQQKREHAGIFAEAARRSVPLVLLLHAPDPASVQRYRAIGAHVVPVPTLDDFPRLAAELTHALFDEGGA